MRARVEEWHMRSLAAPAALSPVPVITAIVVLGIGAAARADTEPETAPIIVTATRVAQPAADALEPVVVIDRQIVERAFAGDVGDVLRYTAGLEVARAGGPGQPTSLFIRGSNSDHAIVMIDGVRINPGTIGGAQLANIDPMVVDHIEVVAGPRSTIYGTDAIGGVVNIITRHDGPTGVAASLGYGRYATSEAAVAGQYTGSMGGIGLEVSNQESNGFPTFVEDWRDRGYRNDSILAHGDTTLGGVSLGARYWQASGTSQYTNPLFNPGGGFTFAPVDERFLNSAGAVEAGGAIGDIGHSKLTLSRVVIDVRQNQVPDFDLTMRNAADWQNDLVFDRQHLTFGVLANWETARSLSFGTAYDANTDYATYYLQDQIEFGINRLLLAIGHNHNSTFGDHTTWNAEYGIRPIPALLLFVDAGTAFHAPDATDRYGYGGNPNLRPEQSRDYEVGARYQINAHQTVLLNYFYNRVDDLIQFVFAPTPANPFGGENENVDRARIQGVEANWEYTGERWHHRLAALYQDATDLGSDSRLLRRARNSFTLTCGRRVGIAEYGAQLLWSGNRADIDYFSGAPVTLGGYFLAQLTAHFAISSVWSVQVNLDNALNRRYELVSDYNTAGRAVSISTRYAVH
jgi:vitamin B12 transporter